MLEGSVRKAGNRVRVTAQLIEAHTDRSLWSESFDRDLNDIFAVQDEISAAVVNHLKAVAARRRKARGARRREGFRPLPAGAPVRPAAHKEGYEKAVELYTQGLAIDGNYAPAWTGARVLLPPPGEQQHAPAEGGLCASRATPSRALKIDPDYAPAYAELSRIALDLRRRSGGGRHGISSAPSPSNRRAKC